MVGWHKLHALISSPEMKEWHWPALSCGLIISIAIAAVFVYKPAGKPSDLQASAGQLTGPAAIINDLTAAGGQAVQFNQPVTSSAGFVHPGILVDSSQLDFVKSQLTAEASTWAAAQAKIYTRYTNPNYVPGPVVTADCSANASGCQKVIDDAIAAYSQALLYYYSTAPDRHKHAKAAVTIMNAWSSTLTGSNGTSSRLTLAFAAEVFPRAAEIIRYTYTPSEGDPAFNVAAFSNMLNNVHRVAIIAGDPYSNGNWELSMADGLINIGIFTDSRETFDTGVAMWRARVPAYIYLESDNGGNGLPIAPPGGKYNTTTVLNCYWLGAGTPTTSCTVPADFRYYNGMTQETCRDMSHTVMGLEAMVNAAETARLQGIDLYGEQQQRITAAYEYNAAFDNQYLTSGTWPAQPCGGRPGAASNQSGDGTGGTGYKLGWEIAYNHYANRLGHPMPNTKLMIDRSRPSGGANHTVWESLTHAGADLPTGCTAPDRRLGTDTITVEVPSDGTYHLWSRLKPAASADTAYAVQVDGGCPITLGGASLPTDQWSWVDYQNGNPTARATVTLTAGTHKLLLIGRSPQLTIDTVLLVNDATCIPVEFGDNCPITGPPLDVSGPSTALVSPANDSRLVGTVNLTAEAADNVGVTKLDILLNDTLLTSFNIPPYSFDWDTTALADGLYTLQTKAYDAAGNSTTSAPVSVRIQNIDGSAPSAPSDLASPTQTANSIDLTWTEAIDDVGVTEYRVFRNGLQIATASTASYTDTGLADGVNYSYVVYAVDQATNVSTASNSLTVTLPDSTAPSVPAGLEVTATSESSVSLSWTASTDNVGIAAYTVFRNGTAIATLGSNTSYTDTNLEPAVTYTYTVSAQDTTGNSSAVSAEVSAITRDATAPSAPSEGTTSAITETTTILSWAASTDNVGVGHYLVYRNGLQVGTTAELSFTDPSLSPATTYSYVIHAVDAAGNISAASNAIMVTTPDTTAPAAATNLVASTTGQTAITLGWQAASDNVGVTQYLVFRDGIQIATTSSTNYTNNGLTAATPYSYVVYARDAAGNTSVASAAVIATIPDTTAPAAPASFTSAITGYGQVTLNWSTATDNVGVTAYRVSRAGTQITQLPGQSHTDSNLSPATSYTYTVVALDAAGNTSSTKTTAIITPANAAAYGTGFAGAYFNNTNLSGPAIGRLDSTINFDWASNAPMAGIGADGFSVRWTGQIKPTRSGTYTFYTQTDDGVRLWLNNTLLIDQWAGASSTASAIASLTSGTAYNIRMEYYDTSGTAFAKLLWSGPSTTKAIIPSSVATSGASGLSASYFTNVDLTGAPALVRLDNNVNFDWGNSSPDSRLPADNFSVRWSGKIKPSSTASYTFYTDSADGVRLWVNGQQIINNWTAHSTTTNSGKISLNANTWYDIRVEYQERTSLAVMKLSWSTSSMAKTIIPQAALRDR
jgi:chitodextrinase